TQDTDDLDTNNNPVFPDGTPVLAYDTTPVPMLDPITGQPILGQFQPRNQWVPKWAVGTAALTQGVAVGLAGATGDPPDDFFDGYGIYQRSPSVQYEVIDPLSRHWLNNNPSG